MTDSQDVHERAQFLRDHGRRPGDVQFFNTEVAFKYKMSSMQAALGLAQLERIEELVARNERSSPGIRIAWRSPGARAEFRAARHSEQLLDGDCRLRIVTPKEECGRERHARARCRCASVFPSA